MIVRASGLGMGVGRLSRPLGGVGELAMPDAGLDTTRHIGSVCVVPLGAGMLRLLYPAWRLEYSSTVAGLRTGSKPGVE